jgi:hypothetical protein
VLTVHDEPAYIDDGSASPDVPKQYTEVLQELTQKSGARLAGFGEDCRGCICAATINVLTDDRAKEALIAADLVRPFLQTCWPREPAFVREDEKQTDDGEDDREQRERRRRAVLHTIYAVCALTEFKDSYDIKSSLAEYCIASLEELHLHPERQGEPIHVACVILASLITNGQAAETLVQEHNIHEILRPILDQHDDTLLLDPIIQIVERLAIAKSNRAVLIEKGLIGSLSRFIDLDSCPSVQLATIAAIKQLIAGMPQSIPLLNARDGDKNTSSSAEASVLQKALKLAHRSDSSAAKKDIGLLMVEVCRTICTATDILPVPLVDAFWTAIRGMEKDFVETLVFVALNGKRESTTVQGWLGLAVLAGWPRGRNLIVDCLEIPGLLAEMRRIAGLQSGPACENLRILLAQFDIWVSSSEFGGRATHKC